MVLHRFEASQAAVSKELPASAWNLRDVGLIPGWKTHSVFLPENPMDARARQATVQGYELDTTEVT